MRVLAIDGGGIRGIIPATVLADLERRSGRPVSGLFDLVAGTSTGGILACALATPGDGGRPRWRAEELIALYRDEGPKIFHRSLLKRVTSADGLLDERYPSGPLEDALRRYLGDARLSQALVPVLVTTYDLQARAPFFFKSWRAELDAPMAEVARATAAAPTYFEPAEVLGRPLIDGGVFAANPAMSAYAEARRLRAGGEPLVISLGTGSLTDPISLSTARGWGDIGWARPVIDIALDGQSDAVDYQLDQVLGDAHHRLQVPLTKASDRLDDARPENIAALEEHGRELVSARAEQLDRLARELAAAA